MSDELERQLEAFGATLESNAGEPIRASDHGTGRLDRSHKRAWAMLGAAACLLAVVVGLVALTGRDTEAPVAQPPAPTSTSTSTSIPPVVASSVDPELLRTAPIAELATGCDADDIVVSADFVDRAASVDLAFSVAHAAIVEHTPPGMEILPTEGWREVAGEPVTVRYLDRGVGVEGIVRIQRDGDGWRVTEIAQCLPGRTPAPIQTTTTPAPPTEPVPDDPLALERDGWTLVERTTEPFAGGEIPCEAAQGLTDFDDVASVHEILTPPVGTGLDLDVHVLDVGSVDRGNELAAAVLAVGDCIADVEGVEVETGAMSSVRASWFRAGADFALVAIVGDGPRSIVLEIEGAPFDDDLIGELAHRADQFLRGVPVTAGPSSGGISVSEGSSLGSTQIEPAPGQVKLWVGNQSFEDDPVAITVEIDGQVVVDELFAVEGQHNWFSFMIEGLEPGEHTITASSDTGVEFAGTFTLPADEPRWTVLDYWYYPGDAEGRHFTFRESDEPVYFA
jgi:hypothetical protein